MEPDNAATRFWATIVSALSLGTEPRAAGGHTSAFDPERTHFSVYLPSEIAPDTNIRNACLGRTKRNYDRLTQSAARFHGMVSKRPLPR